jgi:hypothetical protein
MIDLLFEVYFFPIVLSKLYFFLLSYFSYHTNGFITDIKISIVWRFLKNFYFFDIFSVFLKKYMSFAVLHI